VPLVFFGFLAMVNSSRVDQLIKHPKPILENRSDHFFSYTKSPALARNFEKNSLFFMRLMIVHVNARSSTRLSFRSQARAMVHDGAALRLV
jgi:hypothetical protein